MVFLIKASQLILSLSILVVLHEFGHFIPARLFKTRVEKFYLFFNPWFSLFKRKIGETEWGIGWLPLGGYVKIAGMVDESMDKEQLNKEPQPWEFRSKPAWQRLIIMLGGITVNVLFGLILFVIILFTWGEDKVDQTKLSEGIAVHPYMEQYGFESGDKILKVNDEVYHDFGQLSLDMLIFDARKFEVQHANGEVEVIQLPEDIDTKLWYNNAEKGTFSFRVKQTPVDSVFNNSTAKKIGLQKADKILAVGDKQITYHDELVSALYHTKRKETGITVLRNKDTLHLTATIDSTGVLGFNSKDMKFLAADSNALYTQYYSFGESLTKGIEKGFRTIYGNVAQFKFVFTKKGANTVGGFGAIGGLFPASWDWRAFWSLTAFISIMLAVMNLLPIPALDGGHVVFLLYEMITGREAPQKVLEYAQYVGFVILISLLLYANGNDLYRWITGA